MKRIHYLAQERHVFIMLEPRCHHLCGILTREKYRGKLWIPLLNPWCTSRKREGWSARMGNMFHYHLHALDSYRVWLKPSLKAYLEMNCAVLCGDIVMLATMR